MNNEELIKWFRANGDTTHNLNYNLDENSIVMDLGGYSGVWAKQIIEKYNPNVYIIEPVPIFYDGMVNKFVNNKKVKLMNVGVSDENKNGVIFMSLDGTSSNFINMDSINVRFNTIDTILEKWDLNMVDLLQINIEGDEYPLIEHMLLTGSINKFKNIQVQFHYGVEGDIERYDKISEEFLLNGFKTNFKYPFVWESWGK